MGILRGKYQLKDEIKPQILITFHLFRLEVKAIGNPKPVGKWLKHGTEIIPSDEFIMENFDDGTSVLMISEVYPDDTGEIVFEAHNPLGVAITTTELSVEGEINLFHFKVREIQRQITLIVIYLNITYI